MQRMFFASGNKIYELGVDPQGKTENNLVMRIDTKGFAPAGLYGDVVFRRASINISHDSGFKVKITPILDGKIIEECVMVFSTGQPANRTETIVLDVPLGVRSPSGNMKGARGSNLKLRIETVPLNDSSFFGTVHFDSIQIAYASGHSAAPQGSGGQRSVGEV